MYSKEEDLKRIIENIKKSSIELKEHIKNKECKPSENIEAVSACLEVLAELNEIVYDANINLNK